MLRLREFSTNHSDISNCWSSRSRMSEVFGILSRKRTESQNKVKSLSILFNLVSVCSTQQAIQSGVFQHSLKVNRHFFHYRKHRTGGLKNDEVKGQDIEQSYTEWEQGDFSEAVDNLMDFHNSHSFKFYSRFPCQIVLKWAKTNW